MKIRPFWFTSLLAAGFILCTGCQKNSDEDYKGYYIFGLDANETKVTYEKYTPVSKDTEELVEEFLNKMSDKPEEEAFQFTLILHMAIIQECQRF